MDHLSNRNKENRRRTVAEKVLTIPQVDLERNPFKDLGTNDPRVSSAEFYENQKTYSYSRTVTRTTLSDNGSITVQSHHEASEEPFVRIEPNKYAAINKKKRLLFSDHQRAESSNTNYQKKTVRKQESSRLEIVSRHPIQNDPSIKKQTKEEKRTIRKPHKDNYEARQANRKASTIELDSPLPSPVRFKINGNDTIISMGPNITNINCDYDQALNQRDFVETMYSATLQVPKHNSGISVSPQLPVNRVIEYFNNENPNYKMTLKSTAKKVSLRISNDFNSLISSTANTRESTVNTADMICDTKQTMNSENITEYAQHFLKNAKKDLLNFPSAGAYSKRSVRLNDLPSTLEKNVTHRGDQVHYATTVSDIPHDSSLNLLHLSRFQHFELYKSQYDQDLLPLETDLSPIRSNIYTANTTFIHSANLDIPKKKTLSKNNLQQRIIQSESAPYTCDIFQNIYRDDIINYLISHHTKYILKRNFMSKFNPYVEYRTEILNWIVKHQDILYLDVPMYLMVVPLFDNILASIEIPINMYQLVVLATVWIVTKCQSSYVCSGSSILKVCNEVYSLSQLTKMEKKILKIFKWQLVINEPYTIASHLIKNMEIPVDHQISFTVQYILETFTLSPHYSTFSSCELASSAIYLSLKLLHTYNADALYNRLYHSVGYLDPEEFLDVTQLMFYELKKIQSPSHAVAETYRKYTTLALKKVNEIAQKETETN